MEAAAIGLVSEQLGRQALIVKAVSDHGDNDKDDRFRVFAARASAEVLIRFLLRKLEPREHEEFEDVQEPDSRERGHFSRDDGLRGDTLLSRVETLARLRAREQGVTVEIRRLSARPPFGSYLRGLPDQENLPEHLPRRRGGAGGRRGARRFPPRY